MSAAEIIEQIEQLEPEQKQEVISHFMLAVVAALQSSDGRKLFEVNLGRQLSRRAKSFSGKGEVNAEVSDEFKAVAASMFSQNEELFRKLAQ